MNIGLDVMGGDFAPQATVRGAILAKQSLPASDLIVLIGDQNKIVSLLEEENADPSDFWIVHAPEVIGMGEQPIRSFTQKTNSSITVGFKLLKSKEIHAFSSAGNSGAMLVGSIYSVNNIQGIIRPATSVVFPKENGGVSILLDVGTNPDCKPDVLYQFGLLGSLYARHVYKIRDPKVYLLNIGEEDEKGNILTQSAHKMMRGTTDYRFMGNIEGREILSDKPDVIVCDGFTGNIVLKFMEGFYQTMTRRGNDDEYLQKFNYENYGGSPILGINSAVVIGHGISNPVAIKNMILLAKEVYESKLASKIKKALSTYAINS